MPSNHYTAPYEDYNLPKYPEPSELGKIDYNPYSVTVDTWKFKPLYDEQKYIDEIKYLKEAVEKLLTIISDLTKAK